MLLRRLVEHADHVSDVAPPYYANRRVKWALNISSDGVPLGQLTPFSPSSGKGAAHLVPSVGRTNSVFPTLGVDTPGYVFGWVKEGDKSDRVGRQHSAFVELASRWAAAEPHGPATAIVAFYAQRHHLQIVQPDAWERSDLVAFRVQGELACEDPTAVRFWRYVVNDSKGSGRVGHCLVCGNEKPLVKTVPQQVPRWTLRGARQNASLVSVNEQTHGYEQAQSLDSTPICVDCAPRFMSALTALLNDEQHNVVLPGHNSQMVWWIRDRPTSSAHKSHSGQADFDPLAILDLDREFGGSEPPTVPPADDHSDTKSPLVLCAATLGSNTARVVVRDWTELSLPVVTANIARWFSEQAIVNERTGRPTQVPLWQMASAARLRPGFNPAGSQNQSSLRNETRPDDVYELLLQAALFGKPLPYRLLARVLDQIRVDSGIDTARMAILRLTLRRLPHHVDEREHLMATINHDHPSPAYLAGRIFAVLDATQRASLQPSQQNLSIVNQHLRQALINPSAALVSAERVARIRLRQPRRPSHRSNQAEAHEALLDELYQRLATVGGAPRTANLVDQAYFILGFHQQRADLRAHPIPHARNPIGIAKRRNPISAETEDR